MIQPRSHALAFVFYALAAAACGQSGPAPASSARTKPALADVHKDVSKYVGQSVVWVGEGVSYKVTIGESGKSQKLQFFRSAPPGGDDSFVFAVDADLAKETDACKVLDRTPYAFKRKISGTISGPVEYMEGFGAGAKRTNVPLLSDVLIDVPDAESKPGTVIK